MAARCKLLQVANSTAEGKLASSDILAHETGILIQEDDQPVAKRPKITGREGDEETEEEREEEEEGEREGREVDETIPIGSDSHRVGNRRPKWELTAEQVQVRKLERQASTLGAY